jgi:hypothetical protein
VQPLLEVTAPAPRGKDVQLKVGVGVPRLRRVREVLARGLKVLVVVSSFPLRSYMSPRRYEACARTRVSPSSISSRRVVASSRASSSSSPSSSAWLKCAMRAYSSVACSPVLCCVPKRAAVRASSGLPPGYALSAAQMPSSELRSCCLDAAGARSVEHPLG